MCTVRFLDLHLPPWRYILRGDQIIVANGGMPLLSTTATEDKAGDGGDVTAPQRSIIVKDLYLLFNHSKSCLKSSSWQVERTKCTRSYTTSSLLRLGAKRACCYVVVVIISTYVVVLVLPTRTYIQVQYCTGYRYSSTVYEYNVLLYSTY